MKVSLILQPAVERSRSMLLYAERLCANVRATAPLTQLRIPTVGGTLTTQLLAAPLHLPKLREGIAHVVDHSHSGFLRFLRVPSMVTVHDLIPLKVIRGCYPAVAEPRIGRKTSVWFRWNIGALRRARLVVTPSRATADELRRLIGEMPIEVVPHGIDPEFFEEPDAEAVKRTRERLAPLAGRPFVLQVTNGFFYKNDVGFQRAFSRLCELYPDLTWVRVGAPPVAGMQNGFSPERMLHYADASLGELVALYRLAALLLFPSWDEGFGWPPLEAMAAGCPVVASDHGALAETAAPGALVADPADPDDMARKASELLANEGLRAEVIERGAAHVRTFSWKRAGEQMTELYDRLLETAA